MLYLSHDIKQQATKALAGIGDFYIGIETGTFGATFALKYTSPQHANLTRDLLQKLQMPQNLADAGSDANHDQTTKDQSQCVEIEAKDWVPVRFNNLLDDIVRTRLSNYPVDPTELEVANQYLELFDETHLIKVDYLWWSESLEDSITPEMAAYNLKLLRHMTHFINFSMR